MSSLRDFVLFLFCLRQGW